MTTSKAKLTPTQKKVMDEIEAGGGHAHLRFEGQYGVKLKTLITMWRRNLISYRASGGWAAVCRFGLECREPRQHVLEADLAVIVAALKTRPGWRIECAWELLKAVQDLGTTAIAYHALSDAVTFGKRAGVLTHGTGWDYATNGWDRYVEVVAGN